MTSENTFRTIPGPASHPSPSLPGTIEARIAELERENLRLQRLVAELLFKNQMLRKQEA
jgi:hypothetical protein